MDSEVASQRAPEAAAAVEVNILVCDKGKRNIVDNMEEEKRCKFRADPHVQKAYLAIEAKRKQSNKRNVQRQREKHRMEETEKDFHELKEQLQKEQVLHR